MDRLVRHAIVEARIDDSRRLGDRRSGVAGFMRGPDVVVMRLLGRQSAVGRRSSRSQLRITGVGLLATEETTSARSSSVVVGWGRAVALLLLMMTDEKHLDDGRQEEEDKQDDGDGKGGLLQSTGALQVGRIVPVRRVGGGDAGSRVTAAEGRRDVIAACTTTAPSQNGDGDEGADEEQVEDQGQCTKRSQAADEAREEKSEQCPEHGSSGDALNGFDRPWLDEVMSTLSGEEVGEDAKDEGGPQKLDQSQQRLRRLEHQTTERHVADVK